MEWLIMMYHVQYLQVAPACHVRTVGKKSKNIHFGTCK